MINLRILKRKHKDTLALRNKDFLMIKKFAKMLLQKEVLKNIIILHTSPMAW